MESFAQYAATDSRNEETRVTVGAVTRVAAHYLAGSSDPSTNNNALPMQRHHGRLATVEVTGDGWLVRYRTDTWRCSSLASAFRRAERVAGEYQADIAVDRPEHLHGEPGPRHLIGSPRVYRAQEANGDWTVAMLGRPNGFPDPTCRYVGPSAERAAVHKANLAADAVRDLALGTQSQKDRRANLAMKARIAAARGSKEVVNG